MNKRHLPADRACDDQPEIQARHAGRLRDLAEELQPAFTSDTLDSRGVIAEAYKTAAEADLEPFSLEDAVIVFVHKGIVEASLLFAGVQQSLSQGGLAVLPPATAMTLRLCNADFTIVYLKPEDIPFIQTSLFQGREIVLQLD